MLFRSWDVTQFDLNAGNRSTNNTVTRMIYGVTRVSLSFIKASVYDHTIRQNNTSTASFSQAISLKERNVEAPFFKKNKKRVSNHTKLCNTTHLLTNS